MWNKIISLILGLIFGFICIFGYQKYINQNGTLPNEKSDFSQMRGERKTGSSFSGGLSGTGSKSFSGSLKGSGVSKTSTGGIEK